MHKIKIALKLFNELTAAGTVLDFHQIPFSNGVNIRKEPQKKYILPQSPKTPMA